MGLCLSTTTLSSSSPWPDLPPELAGLILSRLLCHMDRISFGTVCSDWRFAAQHQRTLMPPALPWVNLGRGFYHNLAADDFGNNGKACRHRFATPKGCHAGASFGGWLMYEHKRSHRCFLRDPFSPDRNAIELPLLHRRSTGYVFSDPLARWHSPAANILVCSSHLLVAVFSHRGGLFGIECSEPGSSMNKLSWGHKHHCQDLVYKSIAFHHGRIFVVSSTENLFECEFGAIGEAACRLKHVIKERPAGDANYTYHNHHLVISADNKKLLLVRWTIPRRTDRLLTFNKVDHRAMHRLRLQVFEADLERGEWSSEVKDLGNQVLFVGRNGSRALTAAGSVDRYGCWFSRQAIPGNHVFLLGYELASSICEAANIQWNPDCEQCHDATPSYCVYNMISGKACPVYVHRGPSRVKHPKSAWFFPSS